MKIREKEEERRIAREKKNKMHIQYTCVHRTCSSRRARDYFQALQNTMQRQHMFFDWSTAAITLVVLKEKKEREKEKRKKGKKKKERHDDSV